ncbi:E3 ubiquitin-protein ligase ubr1 [Ophidiomyces ophidiicola]|nr:E3 ubiquitin-protein ligase ubr1 [Ophidiomyces ophidiicola]KAI1931218.1 E3 ubiquitin-protein ligase ubr1 [Ophidiomyces ophidiicola]KAI2148841.1 E3 ubiquitin-protein ligase ubr1 [Ophidiomyces ophidiicola]KAI2405396.1 E3 ubiquitin-protein ligase ubr1 [Ophidiomyces ophidiicola]
MKPPQLELTLGRALLSHPTRYGLRFDKTAKRDLLQLLFRSLTGFNDEYLRLLFPGGCPRGFWSLSEAQGAKEGAEYTDAARGKRCGHLFKAGEALFRCVTCSTDETCALCSRCFNASDHTGHKYNITVSGGHSGCCDCGDEEAFRLPVNCAIHTDLDGNSTKGKASSQLPSDLLDSIQTTIARAFDYFCDVISCSPEQLRLPKTEENIRQDETTSRLSAGWYGGADPEEEEPEFALILWNDEKHTISEVKQQVARACRESSQFGQDKAMETNDFGRSVVKYTKDLTSLLRVSSVIEQIRITVTVRSSRDTYREQMCGAIIEWFSDISGCYIENDSHILRQTICEQMLSPWRAGSRASNLNIGMQGIDDHSREERKTYHAVIGITPTQTQIITTAEFDVVETTDDDPNEGGNDEDVDEYDEEEIEADEEGEGEDEDMNDISMLIAADARAIREDSDIDMNTEDDLETGEETFASYPPPPLPPPQTREEERVASEIATALINNGTYGFWSAENTPQAAEDTEARAEHRELRSRPHGESQDACASNTIKIPKTPGSRAKKLPKPIPYWEIKPSGYHDHNVGPYEDLKRRTRLDWLILYDLRLWKKIRIDARNLCLGTVINVPEFKRILGLRFSVLYTALAQLYLIADREPDHSIINLSLQLVTTPSITEEVIERGNFLTNIMAILYTFLTTRQVGEARDVNPSVTLAMDSASITNRRLYHFFFDLRYLLSSEQVQRRIRVERQYLLQFLDLIKLPQGICPNERAVGEHVEYETDSWISASLLMREINRLCRLFCEAFQPEKLQEGQIHLAEAIVAASVSTMANSIGIERKRFDQAEVKELTRFKSVSYTTFEIDAFENVARHRIVDFVVEQGSMSFHHPLHYTLSWLLECGRVLSAEMVRELLLKAAELSKKKFINTPAQHFDNDDILLAMFDYPLRVCAWLAQLKAGMWVRNGLSLRHQMGQYRSVLSRDVSYYRNIFMIQAAMVICDPSRFLATISDRYGMSDWMKGAYTTRPNYDDAQHIDVAEEFIHLLIMLITERTALLPLENELVLQRDIFRRDIAHALCFKALSYSELLNRVSEKVSDAEDFQDVLGEVANFRPPDGLNDSGIFELKPEYIDYIDPYAAHYSKSQRDEAENIFKEWMAKKTGKNAASIVFEPKLKPLSSGLFSKLSDFSQTPLFAQIINHCLEYCLMFKICTPGVTVTRVETLLHMVLHLFLLAVMEDSSKEENGSTDAVSQSFVFHSLCRKRNTLLGDLTTVSLLQHISTVAEFESCGSKICHILKRLWQKRPKTYATATEGLKFPYDKIQSPSPAPGAESELELKKKRALDRQAKIMAQFQQQQQNFMNSQSNIDWGEEDLSADEKPSIPNSTEAKLWRYPTGNCILCQEETNDSRLYGTFALLTESALFRQTDLADLSYVREAINCPLSLDRSADTIRPFGVASENREKVRRLDSTGGVVISEKQGLGRGFSPNNVAAAPIMTGCGHIMHYSCFETYWGATHRRHSHQVARNHPERISLNEFVCPLCKALGNAFLPIIWKGKEECYPSVLVTGQPIGDFLDGQLVQSISRFRHHALIMDSDKLHPSGYQHLFVDYVEKNVIASLASKVEQLITPSFPPSALPPPPRMLMPGLYPSGDDPIPSPLYHVLAQTESPVSDLVTIYRRLRETFRVNKIPSRFGYQQSTIVADDLIHTDSLIKTFGSSISGVEISQRGVGCELGATLLSTIPQITLTHLRILSETALSYAAIGGLNINLGNKTVYEFRDMHRRKLCQLFLGHRGITGLASLASENKSIEPLFSTDTFIFLAECSLCLVRVLNIDILHMIHICYVAEIVKTALSFIIHPEGLISNLAFHKDGMSEQEDVTGQIDSSRGFIDWIVATYRASAPRDDPILNSAKSPLNMSNIPNNIPKALKLLTARYALPFLRKVVILLHVQYGVEFPKTGLDLADLPEIDRLTSLLRLPSIDQIFESFAGDHNMNPMDPLACGWIAHWNVARLDPKPEVGYPWTPSLPHPGIFELVGLPKYFDTLFEEANSKRCPTTGKELTDPSICLFCGEIFCSQAVCCEDSSRLGGCNRHVKKCGKNVGIFINIRKCALLFLHNQHGCWHYAPYLDIHGEVDLGFRHHRPLLLNQKRYDRLVREAWLTNSIPATVSRKLESEINNGGWETQ